MEIRTIGIDLGKTVFHLVGVNARGELVVRRKYSRTQLLRFTSNLRECLIGMEACGGSHFLGRALRAVARLGCFMAQNPERGYRIFLFGQEPAFGKRLAVGWSRAVRWMFTV